jgi:hypothetical protein
VKSQSPLYRRLGYFIASVWLINGLICKILGLVSRHEAIVERILGPSYAHEITMLIGFAEVCMAIWVLSGKWSRFNALFQMFIIGIMNALELVIAPDLLLWGKANALFAALFIAIIYYREFHLSRRAIQPQPHV